MKSLSVKLKLSIWLTLLMILLASLLLTFLLFISNSVLRQTAMSQLTDSVRSGLGLVSMENGKLVLDDRFSFYHNGVSLLIYSKNEALLAGQLPVTFTIEEPFQNGVIRTVDTGRDQYLILDLWVPFSWEDGVWVRGLMEAPQHQQAVRNMLLAALIALPVFILLAALGGYWIVKRAFRPLEKITQTAAAINEASDLSGRIALPPGRDEFSRLAHTFDQMFERLESSFETEKQFIADASHELRTPVSVIKGACEYAEKYDESPEDRKETIAMIHRQAEAMSNLIAQLLRMTRLEQGVEPIQKEALDLSLLAKQACTAYDGPRFTIHAEDAVIVQGDSALLTRLLINLVENAYKYGKENGHVWVSVSQTEKEALLTVQDDGIGIPPDQQEKVWMRFYQVDASRNNTGAGLGLSMVRQIAQLHGGTVTLESIPGLGTSFTLHLPLFIPTEKKGPES